MREFQEQLTADQLKQKVRIKVVMSPFLKAKSVSVISDHGNASALRTKLERKLLNKTPQEVSEYFERHADEVRGSIEGLIPIDNLSDDNFKDTLEGEPWATSPAYSSEVPLAQYSPRQAAPGAPTPSQYDKYDPLEMNEWFNSIGRK